MKRRGDLGGFECDFTKWWFLAYRHKIKFWIHRTNSLQLYCTMDTSRSLTLNICYIISKTTSLYMYIRSNPGGYSVGQSLWSNKIFLVLKGGSDPWNILCSLIGYPRINKYYSFWKFIIIFYLDKKKKTYITQIKSSGISQERLPRWYIVHIYAKWHRNATTDWIQLSSCRQLAYNNLWTRNIFLVLFKETQRRRRRQFLPLIYRPN